MKYKKLKLCAFLLFGTGFTAIHAQQSVNTTGGNALGSGGSVSYSVGQIIYTTNTGTNDSAAQGVQQPFEISVVTGIKEVKGISLMISTYPNPTTDFLTLNVETIEISTLHYQLFDMNGKLLQNEKISGKQTTIVMRNLSPATYFLKVADNNKEVKTFKIIKTQ